MRALTWRRTRQDGRRTLTAVAAAAVVLLTGVGPALACGGLVAPNGAVRLSRTTTLVVYHGGLEHYLTSFEFSGNAPSFGAIVPLPGVPTAVRRGGSWTLQRLELEVAPPLQHGLEVAAATAGRAVVLLRTTVDALDITVVKGGGSAVGRWAEQNGFQLTPDAPELLDFYARRSPIFLTVRFNRSRALQHRYITGDGVPLQITIPTANPWVPLRILTLGAGRDDLVNADVFLLTDRRPALLSGPGITLRRSAPARPFLLDQLASDRGMGWLPRHSLWLSYLSVNTPAPLLRYDLAADVSGRNRPSPLAAGLAGHLTSAVTLGGPVTATAPWAWSAPLATGALAATALVAATLLARRTRRRPQVLS